MKEYLKLFETKKLVLIMSLPSNDPLLCKTAFESGADAVKVHINVDHKASGTHFGRLEQEKEVLGEMLSERTGPMGLVIGGSLETVELDVLKASALPFSFHSVYAHNFPAWATDLNVPLMAACDGSYSIDEIRQMPACGANVVEASIIPGTEYGKPLNQRDLFKYRLIASNLSIPVVVPTQRAIKPYDVPSLFKTGIKGIMIGAVVTGRTKESIVRAIKAFRKAIDEV